MFRDNTANSFRPGSGAVARSRRRQFGFTLVELSVVLVIIGLIIGAVSIAKDVQRNAIYQRISSDFVQGWTVAYDRFYDGTGRPPGDNAASPTEMVNGVINSELCGAGLMSAMQAAGIEMPAGRAEGSANRYAYLDSNGLPHELEICFKNVSWTEPGATPGTYVVRPRNAMVLKGMTPALANVLDNAFDSLVDAQFGRLREEIRANNTAPVSVGWSVDERVAIATTTVSNLDESQVAEVTGLLKMSR